MARASYSIQNKVVKGCFKIVLSYRVPLQYLTNSAHWGDLVLAVGPGVLVPRPETFCLIEFAQQVVAPSSSLLVDNANTTRKIVQSKRN